jgi:hypothetical protein
MGSIASRTAVREATNICIAPLERLRGRSCGAQNEASDWKPGSQKKLRKSALKPLKQLARVNLCAAPKQESEADDSR